MARKLFCQLSPFCYRISVEKEIMLRNLRDLISPVRFAEHREEKPLPALIKGHRSPMLRQLAGVDMQLQYNKETNLRLAGERIHGLIIEPGQTFSFWHTVGRTTARLGLDAVIAIGPKAATIAETAGPRAQHFAAIEEALPALRREFTPGTAVLVKASHAMEFGKIVSELEKM